MRCQGPPPPPHGHAVSPLPPHAASCARGPTAPRCAAPRRQKPLQKQGTVMAAFSPPLPPRAVPNSHQLALGGRAPAPALGDCDGRRVARVVLISSSPTCLGPVRSAGQSHGGPASARAFPSPFPSPFPPSSSLLAGSECPPSRCVSAAAQHARRALKRRARPVRRPAIGGPVCCRPRRQDNRQGGRRPRAGARPCPDAASPVRPAGPPHPFPRPPPPPSGQASEVGRRVGSLVEARKEVQRGGRPGGVRSA